MSPASKAQQKAVNKYMQENYDRVSLMMPKGKKDVVKAQAAKNGESLNGYINRAIDEAMERDQRKTSNGGWATKRKEVHACGLLFHKHELLF